jgi:hypothetical protein
VTLLGRAPAGPTGRALLESLATSGVAARQVVDPSDALVIEGLGADDVDALFPEEGTRVLVLELEATAPALLRAVELAREREPETTVLLDAAHGAERIPPEVLACVDVLKLSAAAARSLTGRAPTDRLTARWVADRFFEHGVRSVALQVQPGLTTPAGSDGRPPGSQHLLVWAEAERWLPPLDMPAMADLDPGAVFAAWLAVALSRGQPVDELPEGMEISRSLGSLA